SSTSTIDAAPRRRRLASLETGPTAQSVSVPIPSSVPMASESDAIRTRGAIRTEWVRIDRTGGPGGPPVRVDASGVHVVVVADRRRPGDEPGHLLDGAIAGAPGPVGLVVLPRRPALDEHDGGGLRLILVHRDALATLAG